jgi:hypothetical protein
LQSRLRNFELAQSYFLRALKGLVERGIHIHIPSVLAGLGGLATMQEHPESASVLFGTASIYRETMNVLIPLNEHPQLEQIITTARSALGEEAFNAAWSEGRAMTLEQAVAYAIDTFEN